MASGDNEDELLDQLAERLKAIRQDAELVRSGGVDHISAGLERTQADLRELATSLQALSLRIEQQQQAVAGRAEQQQAVATRVEAVAKKVEADAEAQRQTFEALSVQVRQQGEMLDRLSAPRRSRLGALRAGLAIVVLLAGVGIAALVVSGHDIGLDAIKDRITGWFSALEGGGPTRSGGAAGYAATTANATPGAKQAAQPLVPDARAAASDPATAGPAKDVAPPAEPTASADAAGPSGAPATEAAIPPQPEAPAAEQPAAALQSPSAEAEAPHDAPPAIATAQVAAADAANPAEAPAKDAAKSPQTQEAVVDLATAPPGPRPAGAERPSEAPLAKAPAASEVTARDATPPVSAEVSPKLKATHQLALRATEDAWVRVHASDGRVVFSRTLRKGEIWSVPSDSVLMLDTGNAGALDVQVDGVKVSLSSAKNGVIRNVPLDADARELSGQQTAR